MSQPKLRRYQSAVWDEPLIMEMSVPGRRAQHFDAVEEQVRELVGPVESLIPSGLRRPAPPDLPELSEPDVLRHYLHLSQETLGMMGISLFGTCTMKYNPRVNEALAALPEVAAIHPEQDPSTMQGMLVAHSSCSPR